VKPPQFAYRAYGLWLASDRLIPGLTPLDFTASKTPDLCIQFEKNAGGESDPAGETLWYTAGFTDENGNPILKIWKGNSGGDFFIRYSHGLTFRVDAALGRIDVYRAPQTSEKDVPLYVLGPVLGIVLRLRGLTCLHASAVEMAGKAVAFAGEMGAGKSTTASIFAQNGHAVLTDDIVALEKRGSHFSVQPGYPYLNLLPDSMALLSGEAEALPSAEPVLEKTKLMLDGKEQRFQSEELPLGAIYILAERSNEASSAVAESIAPQEALIALASNTYANKMLDAAMRAREFCTLGELVRSVPIRRLVAPARPTDARSLYRAIFDDAAAAMKSRME
jgi:hypothetical protein